LINATGNESSGGGFSRDAMVDVRVLADALAQRLSADRDRRAAAEDGVLLPDASEG
jgi:hypothetical protein